MSGKIKKLFDTYGFIKDDTGADYFFHIADLEDGVRFNHLKIGQRMDYEILETERGKRAVKVIPRSELKGL
jgi:cold shock CspA family protein